MGKWKHAEAWCFATLGRRSSAPSWTSRWTMKEDWHSDWLRGHLVTLGTLVGCSVSVAFLAFVFSICFHTWTWSLLAWHLGRAVSLRFLFFQLEDLPQETAEQQWKNCLWELRWCKLAIGDATYSCLLGSLQGLYWRFLLMLQRSKCLLGISPFCFVGQYGLCH